ncbi:hypothetical protein [Priestia megaterium]|nr:hypothetical protein [Priestia megaterium]
MMDVVLRINSEEKTRNVPFILEMTYKKYIALQEIEDFKKRLTIKQLEI